MQIAAINQDSEPAQLDRRVSIAPMLDWTTRHARYFLRQFHRNLLLYTEMVTTGALLNGDPKRFLAHHPAESPLAVQLGGSDPDALAACASLCASAGFDEINLNVGCPSDRVQSGRFGACLMLEPELVRDSVSAMREATVLPVTVKCRLGVDNHDDYAFVRHFVETVAGSGCRTFIVHARKAWLSGLSPKQNREIPPLIYDRVYHLKQEFSELEIIINGGIHNADQVIGHLEHVDGVMIGREAFKNPYALNYVVRMVYGAQAVPGRRELIERYRSYVEAELDAGTALRHLVPPLMGLFQGVPGARAWRRHLSTNAVRSGSGMKVIDEALEHIGDE